ncbi:nucleosome assembly protein 1 1-like [Tropilaelaps mercedesae]|uniref:Nucleosome assembly protein 1 1-like n=1 Tax=Tropilaelaps mercedesae TaxID=418985 RepID=A0A1V9WY64_9ACAR|nr:nucleosome assembly protein 1 1-like [Tropilaelaps mercedesae]
MVEVENEQRGGCTAVRTTASVVSALPCHIKERIDELRKLQVDYFKIQADFHREVAELEHKYYGRYEALVTKRRDIVNGVYKPVRPEASDKGQTDELASVLKNVSISDAPVAGIPCFWLTCMKNVTDDVHEFITEGDEPILQYLIDVAVEDNIESFKLHFHFSPNEFFSNAVLTKEFKLKLGPDDEEPLSFEGPEIIEWRSEEKNVTQHTVINKQKNKKTGKTRTVMKTIQTESFFNFFSNPDWIEDKEDMGHEHTAAFQADVSLGSFFRERFVPRAILYFTGEIGDDYDDYNDDDDDFEDIEDTDVESEDASKNPMQKIIEATGQQEECRQQ